MRHIVHATVLAAVAVVSAACSTSPEQKPSLLSPEEAARLPPRGNALTSYENVTKLTTTEPSRNAFAAALQREYLAFSQIESRHMRDYVSADYFARKGLLAALNPGIPPEDPYRWSISNIPTSQLLEGRKRLVTAFEKGARSTAPEPAAVAQARYDCWVEQEEEGYQPDHIAACKHQFVLAMRQLEETLLADARKVEPAPQVPAPPAPAKVETQFMVQFDFDRSSIRSDALPTIRRAAAAFRNGSNAEVEVVGHTDTAGPSEYNVELSRRRAVAVRQALEAQGVPVDRIRLDWRGQTEPAVPTDDNVPYQANRRASIKVSIMPPASPPIPKG